MPVWVLRAGLGTDGDSPSRQHVLSKCTRPKSRDAKQATVLQGHDGKAAGRHKPKGQSESDRPYVLNVFFISLQLPHNFCISRLPVQKYLRRGPGPGWGVGTTIQKPTQSFLLNKTLGNQAPATCAKQACLSDPLQSYSTINPWWTQIARTCFQQAKASFAS